MQGGPDKIQGDPRNIQGDLGCEILARYCESGRRHREIQEDRDTERSRKIRRKYREILRKYMEIIGDAKRFVGF
jgi:hypothetical protein